MNTQNSFTSANGGHTNSRKMRAVGRAKQIFWHRRDGGEERGREKGGGGCGGGE